jgi:hypothetical protein
MARSERYEFREEVSARSGALACESRSRHGSEWPTGLSPTGLSPTGLSPTGLSEEKPPR